VVVIKRKQLGKIMQRLNKFLLFFVMLISVSVFAQELNVGSFSLDVPDQWQLVRKSSNTFIYRNDTGDTIRISIANPFDSKSKSVRSLKKVMQKSATQNGLKTKRGIRLHKKGGNVIWGIDSVSTLNDKYLFQYGTVGESAVVFIAHTAKEYSAKVEQQLIDCLKGIE
jgi:hypothetical protein